MPTKVRATGTPAPFNLREKPSTISSKGMLRRPASASQAAISEADVNLGLCPIARAAIAFVDLMQLHHVATGIVHEHLQRVGAGEALDLPVLHAHAVEFLLGGEDIGHRESDVRPGRILAGSLGDRRRLLA